MLTCDFAPAAPADSSDQQSDSAAYEAELFSAWESCYGNLFAVSAAYYRWLAIIEAARAKETEQ